MRGVRGRRGGATCAPWPRPLVRTSRFSTVRVARASDAPHCREKRLWEREERLWEREERLREREKRLREGEKRLRTFRLASTMAA